MLRRLGVIALLVLLAVPAAEAGRFTLRGTVTRVVDGDTVDVRLASGKAERVRLIGIDTPERGTCGYAQASAAARTLALRRAVVLKGDATQATRDRYGRLLAYVWVRGRTDLGLAQLRAAHARVYVFGRPFSRLAVYRRAERPSRCSQPPPPASGACDPSYPGVCVPPPPPDLDCKDVAYVDFAVVGADPHRFDGDGDGRGCEG